MEPAEILRHFVENAARNVAVSQTAAERVYYRSLPALRRLVAEGLLEQRSVAPGIAVVVPTVRGLIACDPSYAPGAHRVAEWLRDRYLDSPNGSIAAKDIDDVGYWLQRHLYPPLPHSVMAVLWALARTDSPPVLYVGVDPVNPDRLDQWRIRDFGIAHAVLDLPAAMEEITAPGPRHTGIADPQPPSPDKVEHIERPPASRGQPKGTSNTPPDYDWDVFVCHAWEDKEAVVRDIAKALSGRGIRVWYDEDTLKLGDGLRRSIDNGLAKSRYGVVVLSKHFFKKEWSQKELDGLVTRERNGEKVILPVWHGIVHNDVANHSPMLADKVAAKTQDGLDAVVTAILAVVAPEKVGPSKVATSPTAQPVRSDHLQRLAVATEETVARSKDEEARKLERMKALLRDRVTEIVSATKTIFLWAHPMDGTYLVRTKERLPRSGPSGQFRCVMRYDPVQFRLCPGAFPEEADALRALVLERGHRLLDAISGEC